MRRADRLFRIILLLARGRAVTASRLAETLEVSERTVYRDMADLIASGVPIDGAAGVGYLMRRGFHLPPLMFDAEELAALALGSRMVQGWGDRALGQAAARALLKIESVVPPALHDRLNSATLVVPNFHVPTAMVAPLGLLRQAIEALCKVGMDYRRADGETSQRVVHPLGLFFWGGTWTLAAWCEMREDFRTFRLDRIAGLRMLDERFEAAGGRTLQDYLQHCRDDAPDESRGRSA
jgi:predicted DNA-binding transcriptional regulator YafY